MHVKQYEDFVRDVWFVEPADDIHDLAYSCFGVAGEGGEVADEFKKHIREHGWEYTPALRLRLGRELADVLYYVTRAGQFLDYTLEDIMMIGQDNIRRKQAAST